MPAGQRSGAFGKRAAYGLVAATCALIGIAALALQFYTRQGSRAVLAAPPPAATAVVQPPVANASPAPASSAVLRQQTTVANLAAAAPGAAPVQRDAVVAPAARAAPSALSPAADLAAPTTPAERQARCLEILQKASLEPISQAETAFFKTECK
jgi:hypothetical protein